MRGRAAVSPGARPCGSTYVRGAQAGVEAVAITAASLPIHGHGMNASPVPNAGEGSGTAVGNSFATLTGGRGTNGRMYAPLPATSRLAPATLPTGGNGTHTNLQPFLALRYVIALVGTFPQRP